MVYLIVQTLTQCHTLLNGLLLAVIFWKLMYLFVPILTHRHTLLHVLLLNVIFWKLLVLTFLWVCKFQHMPVIKFALLMHQMLSFEFPPSRHRFFLFDSCVSLILLLYCIVTSATSYCQPYIIILTCQTIGYMPSYEKSHTVAFHTSIPLPPKVQVGCLLPFQLCHSDNNSSIKYNVAVTQF